MLVSPYYGTAALVFLIATEAEAFLRPLLAPVVEPPATLPETDEVAVDGGWFDEVDDADVPA